MFSSSIAGDDWVMVVMEVVVRARNESAQKRKRMLPRPQGGKVSVYGWV